MAIPERKMPPNIFGFDEIRAATFKWLPEYMPSGKRHD